jgi:hypothetical protein
LKSCTKTLQRRVRESEKQSKQGKNKTDYHNVKGDRCLLSNQLDLGSDAASLALVVGNDAAQQNKEDVNSK